MTKRIYEMKDQGLNLIIVDLDKVATIIIPNQFAVNNKEPSINGSIIVLPGTKLDAPVNVCRDCLAAWKEYHGSKSVEYAPSEDSPSPFRN